MKLRYKKTKKEFYSNSFNKTAINEVLTNDDSVFFNEIDAFINDKWLDFSEALKTKLIIPDNYNVNFKQPSNKEEKERGWY